MAKSHTIYVCTRCGATQQGWLGRCPHCGEWNTLRQQAAEAATAARSAVAAGGVGRVAVPLRSIAATDEPRLPMPMAEVSRVLGGGLVPGSVVLLAGEPGIGKSTLALQMARHLAQQAGPVLYVSGEESARQVGLRAKRLGDIPPELYILSEAIVESVAEQIAALKPLVTVIDSIQAVRLEGRPGAAGSVVQVRDSAAYLTHLAKDADMPLLLVGHVTKSGAIAGPRVLEHVVDTVLYMEGDRYHANRMLRSVKNRFGSTNEVGVFEMTQEGLREVANPSESFLAERLVGSTGSTIAVVMEGTRPMLVEVQALTSKAPYENVRRTANGFDFQRLLLLAAVLSKRAGLALGQQDLFVNVVGGLRLNEPAADLAVAVSIASSVMDKPVPADTAVVGEVGLSGEVRSVAQLERRVLEAARLGFRAVVVPRAFGKATTSSGAGCEVVAVRSVRDALKVLQVA